MTKPLNVGIIGYGFMGRTHSNAYRKVRNFFDVPYEPVLQDHLRLGREGGEGLRRPLGLQVARDRLAQGDRRQGHRPRRHLRAEQLPRGDRHRRGQGRQDDRLREAAGAERARRPRRWSRPSRRPAWPTWSRSTTAACRPSRWPSSSSTRAGSAASSTTAPTSSRTGRSRPTCRRAAWPSGGSTSRRPAPA